MPKLLHAADIHVDSPLHGLARHEGAPVQRLRLATRRAFERLVDLAIEEDVQALVIAGDLYDGALRDASSGLRVRQLMVRLQEVGIHVVIVAGNHDAASEIPRHVQLPDNCHVLSTKAPERVLLEEAGVVFFGQGFATRSVTKDLSAAYPDAVPGLFNVGVLHTALEGRVGHSNYAPCTVDALRRPGYGYWALGHVHAREVVATDPWVVFPGNLQGRGVHEAGPKGCSLVSWEGERVVEVVHRPCDVVRWANLVVDASGATTLDEAIERARPVLSEALDAAEGRLLAARVELRGAGPAHRELVRHADHAEASLRALASDLGELWVAEVRLRMRPAIELAALRARDDAIGAVAAALEDPADVEALLAACRKDLETLQAALPLELRGPSGTADPEVVRVALADARDWVLGQLLANDEEVAQ